MARRKSLLDCLGRMTCNKSKLNKRLLTAKKSLDEIKQIINGSGKHSC